MSLFIVVAEFDAINHTYAITWFVLNLGVISFRFYAMQKYKNSIAHNVPFYYRIVFIGALLSAFLWAGGTFLFFVKESVAHQAFLALMYAGITAGAMVLFSARKEIFITYSGLYLIPLIYQFFIHEGELNTILALSILLYYLFLCAASVKYEKMVANVILTKNQNNTLLKEMGLSKKRVEELNRNLNDQLQLTNEKVDQLEKTKEELLKASNIKSMFLANMSHEIRTPMNGIYGFLQLLEKTELNQKQAMFVSSMAKSTQHLLQIINDILDISKIESGKVVLEYIPVDIKDDILDALRICEPKAKEKSITLTMSCDEQIYHCIETDKVRLVQVLLNLLNNAIKFTPEHGKVALTITLLEESDTTQKILFEVKDSGIGIDSENIEQIFNPFTQGDVTTTRKFGGTGLGLSICSSLLTMMKSKLLVESAINKGSRFFFTLTVKKSISCIKKPQDEATSEPEDFIGNGRVLVVDDNKTNLLLMEALLEEYSLEADFAQNGQIAVDKVKQNHYMLVLMDISMPVMNGLEATAEIRKFNKYVPIIALTANAMQKDKEKYLLVGMNEYMQKPISIHTLSKMLKQFNIVIAKDIEIP